MTQKSYPTVTGSLSDIEYLYRKVLTHNLMFGWWGFPFGLVWTPLSIAKNRRARNKIRQRAAEGTAAEGWYRDPSGRNGQRYWDGHTWSDQVRTVSSDPASK